MLWQLKTLILQENYGKRESKEEEQFFVWLQGLKTPTQRKDLRFLPLVYKHTDYFDTYAHACPCEQVALF